MLDVVGAGISTEGSSSEPIDFVSHFQSSHLFHQLQENLVKDGVTIPSKMFTEVTYKTKRAASAFVQMRWVVHRCFVIYWRTASYNLTRIQMVLIIGILFGLIYSNLDFTSYSGINSAIGFVCSSLGFMGSMALYSVAPLIETERASYYRERVNQTYNALWYAIGFTLAEIPHTMFSILVYCAISFPLVGFTGLKTFLLFWFVLSLHVLTNVFLGQLLGAAFSNVETASIACGFISGLMFLLMGFNPPASELPMFYKWLHMVNPYHYSFNGLIAILFGDCPEAGGSEIGCSVLQGNVPAQFQGKNLKFYIGEVFEAHYGDVGISILWLLVLLLASRILALCAWRYINHQTKKN